MKLVFRGQVTGLWVDGSLGTESIFVRFLETNRLGERMKQVSLVAEVVESAQVET